LTEENHGKGEIKFYEKAEARSNASGIIAAQIEAKEKHTQGEREIIGSAEGVAPAGWACLSISALTCSPFSYQPSEDLIDSLRTPSG
jgi:hypothetical protein